jgi:hypothetical protein
VGHGDVVGVSCAEQQDARAAPIIDKAVDLGRSTTPGTAYALDEGPPLAPAAERWALTEVESMAAEE